VISVVPARRLSFVVLPRHFLRRTTWAPRPRRSGAPSGPHMRCDGREIRHSHHRGCRKQPGAAGPLGEAFPHPICGGRGCHARLPYSGV